jgi:hypothetical protein
LVEKALAGVAEGGQQGVAHVEQAAEILASAAAPQGPPPGLAPIVDDVGPVLGAGIEEKQVHRAMAGQNVQGVQVHRRQGGEPEEAHPLGQGAGRRHAPVCGLAERVENAGPVHAADAAHHHSPQDGLPMVFPAGLPVQHHVRSINQVLIEDVGDAPGELIGLEAVGVVLQVAF